MVKVKPNLFGLNLSWRIIDFYKVLLQSLAYKNVESFVLEGFKVLFWYILFISYIWGESGLLYVCSKMLSRRNLGA